ncbi:BrnT family toxin [Deinococcus gobiensis]|uniref:BrnT family toxin n=1 Tax=Deinococcus gobiensis (strain DSM 21396 / JCM 16679 / CGMCC 1.7299 / I-0) TaxID=745776 RepID=H8H1T2_DEIGI|nr:BrnT family toxin [Deinococcus gobiensis]AFD27479.1 hypothetical protein DGo_PB0210 [Deinococcus gobiensis I-0]
MEFDWDDANTEHIARHAVHPEEAEEAVTDPDRVGAPAYHAQNGERRQAITGQTEDGRLLTVILTRRDDLLRVITARDASESERRAYRR